MKVALEKDLTFEAAHRLPHHPGKCSRLHGHSYRLTLRLVSDSLGGKGTAEEGMVLDTAEVSAIVGEHVLSLVDHYYLNEVPGLEVPTTENVVRWIYERLKPQMRGRLERVELHEGFTSRAVYPA